MGLPQKKKKKEKNPFLCPRLFSGVETGVRRSTPDPRWHWRREGEQRVLRGRLCVQIVGEGFGISPVLPLEGCSTKGEGHGTWSSSLGDLLL